MTAGMIVWCTIVATISIMGNPIKDHETAAKGRIIRVDGEWLQVDFSEYARKQQYIGQYYDIRVNKDACVEE